MLDLPSGTVTFLFTDVVYAFMLRAPVPFLMVPGVPANAGDRDALVLHPSRAANAAARLGS
jgi:hypothetical protein